jgi:hypothetical protein
MTAKSELNMADQKLTARQLYDYRDQSRAELLLVRAGQHLWVLAKKLRAKNALPDSEGAVLSAALETIWEAKRNVRQELKEKRREEFKRWRGKELP